MFKGSLRIAILKILSNGNYSGYGIRKELIKKAGWAPSYGSLFPNLKDLEKRKIISSKKNKNKNIYSITKKGEKLLKTLRKNSDDVINKIIRNIDAFGFLWDIDERKMNEIKYMIKTMKNSFSIETKAMEKFSNVIFEFMHNGKMKNKNIRKFNSIISDATRKLKKLLKE